MSTYIGIDPSLTATGWCVVSTDGLIRDEYGTVRAGSRTGCPRLITIRDAILGLTTRHAPTLVAIEGYAFGRPNGMAALGELGGLLRVALYEAGVPYVDVPPAKLKKFATGTGTADKGAMLAAAIRRLYYPGSSHDEADAGWLAHLAAHVSWEPQVALPAAHLAALVDVGAAVARTGAGSAGR